MIELLHFEPHPLIYCVPARCGNYLRAGFISFISSKKTSVGTIQGQGEFKEIWDVEKIAKVKCDISRIGHQNERGLTWPD